MMMRTQRKTRGRKTGKAKFSKIVVAALLTAVAAFTVAVLVIFFYTGSEPTTLIVSFFGFAGGEAGVLGLIRHSDNKYQEGGSGDGDGRAG